MKRLFMLVASAVLCGALVYPVYAEETDPQYGNEPEVQIFDEENMTFERLVEIGRALDENVEVQGKAMRLVVQEIPITVVTDQKANRMRAFVPFKNLDGVDGQTLYRMMQANFDSTLDARYAIAKGHVVSVFIHPLAELKKDQFIEGLGQVANLVLTYGNAYTSGAMTFGGGDSRDLHRKLIDELLEKGDAI
ncbi:MAG: hypothetical protein AAGA76_13565 [Pseudomonadota bacterium]